MSRCEGEPFEFTVEHASGALFAFDDVADLDEPKEFRSARAGGIAASEPVDPLVGRHEQDAAVRRAGRGPGVVE